jgi:DNA-binding SARP family transcriptional activator/Tfp pilus assembly protein PilF
MDPMIQLRVLGRLELTDSRSRDLSSVLAQPKRLALLVYLAVARPRGFHRRDTLLGLFWPEFSDERARGALNQAIYHLRGILGRDVLVSRGYAELGVDPHRLRADAASFEGALDSGRPREALDLYGGDLLPGFHLSEVLEWERWLEDERARLRSRASAGAWSLAEAAAGAGNAVEAARWGERSVALAPGDETRLREWIALLDRMGNRSGALTAYEEAAGRLARDLDIGPSPDLVALVQEIRSREGPVARHPSESPDPGPPADSAGQGRDRGAGEPGTPAHSAGTPARRRRAALGAALALVGVMAWAIGNGGGGNQPKAERLASGEPPGPHPEAYQEYLRGRHFLAKLEAGAFGEARRHFEAALDLDPTFAPAWSGLAEAYTQLTGMMVLPAGEAYPRARRAAERALELDPSLAEAHAALAMAVSMYYWDTEAADRHFRRAIQEAPDAARPRRLYAAHLRNLGRFDEALDQIERATELDPFFAFAHVEEGLIHLVARRHDEALAKFRRYLQVAPDDAHVHVFIAMVLIDLGRYEEALVALGEVDPAMERPDALALRGIVHAHMGRHAQATDMLRMLERLEARGRPVSPFHHASVHVALSDHARALDLLESAAEEPTWEMRLLKVVPTFDPLRSSPRFQALLERIGLADPPGGDP